MKSYAELKAEMELMQQQMVEAKKNQCTNALKEVKRLCKDFGLSMFFVLQCATNDCVNY